MLPDNIQAAFSGKIMFQYTKHKNQTIKQFLVLCGIAILTACSSNGPHVKNLMAAQGHWQNINRIHNGNIEISYDSGSLKKQGNTVSIRDRKIVRDTNKETYYDTPNYKIAISDWEFHCTQQTYRLVALQFWDNKKNEIAKYQYTSNQIQPMPIMQNTPTQALFDIACHNKK